MLLVFSEMINGGIYHYLSNPSFKGADNISISWLVMVYFFKHLQKSIIQDLKGIILFAGIAVADGHSIPIERAINNFLALPSVEGTAFNVVSEFFC
jgi:hypothetical protein